MNAIQPYPKRLIEVDLPIRRISVHARREKSIRHGHISTLHIWWARRPLAACRATVCAALWPDPADECCPSAFRTAASEAMVRWAREQLGRSSIDSYLRLNRIAADPDVLNDPLELRGALLDFIADFADWDNSSCAAFVETARFLTGAAHSSLGGLVNSAPTVFDPFAGGGSFPLEAARIAATAIASDLNPIAVLINKVQLEYIPKWGNNLAIQVRQWGDWMRQQAVERLGAYYPEGSTGGAAIAYVWARTITCEGPACGIELPLIRSLQLTKEGKARAHLSLEVKPAGLDIRVVPGITDRPGTVRNGSANCPSCGYTTQAKSVRTQLAAKHGGSDDARLLAVYVEGGGSRHFRDPETVDIGAFAMAAKALHREDLPQDLINPIRPYGNSRGLSAVTRIGITRFGDLYNPRQAVTLLTLRELAISIPKQVPGDPEFGRAVGTLLSLVASRYIFQNCALSRWNATGAKIEGAFGKQALQVVWDFAEANPFSNGSANWNNALDWVVEVIEENAPLHSENTVLRAAAQDALLPDDSVDLLATDPPYFAAIPYSDLSNVFFVWERDVLKTLHPELYSAGLVEQGQEIIVTNANTASDGSQKTPDFFRREMATALEAARRAVVPSGLGVVVFADSSTDSWESILGAIIDAGWMITASWPIDTELQNRTQAQGAASLQSSIHIVCRPRESENGARSDRVGDWRDILAELPKRIHAWMPRLAAEGVVGADAIFACLGPALEIFSQFSRVEKASGEHVELREYLEQVWAAVAKEALSMVLDSADTSGFEPDGRLTAMWLWTISGRTGAGTVDGDPEADPSDGDEDSSTATGVKMGFAIEYDAARKIAQGLGARLEDLDHLIEVKGSSARLMSPSERTRYLFSKGDNAPPGQKTMMARKKQLSLFSVEQAAIEEGWNDAGAPRAAKTTLDRVHQSILLFGSGRIEALKRFLVEEGVGNQPQFWKLSQSLSALYPTGTDEKRWIDGVLARKKSFGFA